MILNLFKADIKFISRKPMLLMAFLAPFVLIIALRLGFPLFSNFIFLKTGFLIDSYYTLVAITFVSIIPLLFGMVYAFLLLDKTDLQVLQVIALTHNGKKILLNLRMIVPVFMSFIMILLSVILTNPVPDEGWLRTIFVSILLSAQSPFIFLFIGSLAENKTEGLALTKLYGIFLITVPLGLILHHPWNYLAFFSPLYWLAWAWIARSAVESLIYGAIAGILTLSGIIIFFRHFLRKHTN